jgi:hypothetical protein
VIKRRLHRDIIYELIKYALSQPNREKNRIT